MKTEEKSLQLAPPVAGDTIAVIETDMGTIKIKLFPEQTPESVKNFQELAKAGKSGVPLPCQKMAEEKILATNWAISVKKTARADTAIKASEPDQMKSRNDIWCSRHGSPTPARQNSQFYIVTNKNGTPSLNGGYTVFGQVYEGLDIVDKIAAVETDPATDRPLKDILMKSVTVMPYSS
jgi:peptidyl-prolyl cis-trans isomerase B (cyclophilin B)